MNWKKISLSILGGCVITFLTGLFSNMPPILVGASYYGYPFAWLVRLILAPEYFPWRVNLVNFIVDIIFWTVIIGIVLLIVAMRGRRKMMVVLMILLVLFITSFSIGIFYYQQLARGGGSDVSDIRGLADIDDIEIVILESFPVQVNVIVKGSLPDPCTEIDKVTINKEDNLFLVTITTLRPAEAVCAQVVTPFEEVVALDVVDLKAGIYAVDVNGVTGTFELQIDNISE